MGKNVRQGIAEVSEGEKWEWYGSGKTSFAGTRKLELNYSVATTIDAGISSKLTVGASSSVAWDNSIKAEFGASMKYSASKTIEFKRSAGFSHQDAYAGTVGADAVHNLNIRKVSIALKIVLSIQTVLVLALLGTVAGVQIKNQDKVVDVYTGKENGLSLNVIASITTAITTVLSILTIYWAKNKSFLEKNNPAAAVTLDAAQGVFMGMNRSGTLAGLTMNTKAIDLAIAPTGTLNYLKPKGSSSIIGITQADTLGTAATGGTRLKLAADGTINLNGTQSLAVTLQKKGSSDTSISMKAQKQEFQVTNAQGADQGALLSLHSDRADLKFNDNNNLKVADNSVELLGGNGSPQQSMLSLNGTAGTLQTGGTLVKTSATGIALSFGTSQLTIDASGFSFNKDLQILAPSGPKLVTAELQKAMAGVVALGKLRQADQAKIKALKTLADKQGEIEKVLEQNIIALREKVHELTDSPAKI